MSEIVDMSFKEMIEGLFNTDFLTSEELETICKAGELYAEAKLKNKVEADAAPDGWISVEDRLPEKDKYVLLYNGHWIGVGKYHPDVDDTYEPHWQDETTEYIHPIPTHWQPLPPPPKKQ